MAQASSKLSRDWILRTREYFLEFLEETGFPNPERLGERGPKLRYPEWLIMFIALLSVKLKIKTYIQIHRMCVEYWPQISEGQELDPISERQLRDRLKKICHYPRKPAAFISQIFLEQK